MTVRRRAALAAILLLTANCAERAAQSVSIQTAHPPRETCQVTTAARMEAWQRVAAGQIVWHVYDGAKASSALALYDALPPQSDTRGDWIALGLLPDAPRAVALVGRGGCMVEETFIRREDAERIVGRIDGLRIGS